MICRKGTWESRTAIVSREARSSVVEMESDSGPCVSKGPRDRLLSAEEAPGECW